MVKDNPATKLWNIIKSKKLAVALILILAVVSTVGMLSPGLAIFQTQWFTVLGIVFLVNLTACTVQQLINASRLWQKRNFSIKSENNVGEPISHNISVFEAIGQVLQKRRYKPINGIYDNCLWNKGNIGIWGASLFHLGLILITLGALLSGATKMSGYMKITEGEVRYEQHRDYEAVEEGSFFQEGWHTGIGIRLNKQNVTVDKNGEIDEIISDLSIVKDGNVIKNASLGEKEPVIYDGVRIFQKDAGFAPFIEIIGPDNSKLAETYIILETDSKGDKAQFYLKGLQIPNSPYAININFYPDMVQRGNEIATDKYTLSNPAVLLTLFNSNRKVNEKVVRVGQTVDLSGYRFKLGNIRHWNGFEIVNDRGADYVFAGSWVSIVGLILMYLIPFKKVQVYIEDSNLGCRVIGVTNRSRKVFEEELMEIQNEASHTLRQ